MTPQQLVESLSIPLSRAAKWAQPLTDAAQKWEINTRTRMSMFVAQIGHESGRLIYVRELWGPTPAQMRYEGRQDLGNTEAGDGRKFLGRGLIQITGRTNYARCSEALKLPLLDHPELLEQPDNAANSAAWFWNTKGLNELADASEFEQITRRINGGLIGLAERQALLAAAARAFS